MHFRSKNFIALFSAGCLALGALDSNAHGASTLSTEIEVLGTGSGDKSQLRYTPEAGAKAGFTVNMKMTSAQSMGGQEMPAQEFPPMITDYLVRVEEVRDTGEIVTVMEVTDARIGAGGNPMVRGGIEQGVKQTIGTKTRTILKDSGETVSSETMGADGVQMPSGMQQMQVRFPDEEMGVGGRWVERREIDQNGIKVQQETTYEVKSMEGEEVMLEMNITMTAPRQAMNDPRMPAGSMELLSMSGAGKGSVKLDLVRMIVVESDLELETSQEIQMSMQGMENTVTGKTTMQMTMEDREVE